jgi:Zn-finger nucleic acid-binding protein
MDAKVLTRMVARRSPGRTGPLRLRRATLPARHRDGRERVCPRCPDLFIKPRLAGRLMLDRCPECGGLWFDGGELAGLLRSRSAAKKRRAGPRRRSIARRLRREIAEEARQRKADDFDLVTICDVLVQLVGRLFSRR